MDFVLASVLMVPLLLQGAAGVAPTFHDYPVARERVAHPAKVQLADAKSQQYATRLREFAVRRPNFAGHFILASWGCGASCVMTAAINAQTGEVAWLPFTVCCWAPNVTKPLEFHPNSRLLIVHGSRNESGGGTYDYSFDGKTFTLLRADEGR